MRRKDREITDYGRMIEIMKACDCCRVGFVDEEGTYIVPLNFGFSDDGKNPVLYFHGAAAGKKMDLIREQSVVGFEMDAKHQVVGGDDACDYGFLFSSIIGKGRISVVTEYQEQVKGLQLLMEHYTGKSDWSFPPQAFKNMAIVRLQVTGWTCKEHQ